MKTSSRASRQTLEPRLRAYSHTAAAALVATAAATMAATASAQIVTYTAADIGTASGTIASLGAGGPGAHSMGDVTAVISYRTVLIRGYQANDIRTNGTHRARGGIYLDILPSAGIAVPAGGYVAKNLAFGEHVDGAAFRFSAATVFGTFALRANTFVLGGNRRGSFQPAGSHIPATGYLGVRIHNNYGWIHIAVGEDANGRPNSIALTPGPNTGDVVAAFNSDPSGAITAGQISAIPEPATVATGLALFALGAVGVREHRRRRKLAA